MQFLGALGGLSSSGFNPGTLSPFAQNHQNYSYNKNLQQQNFEQTDKLNQNNYDRRIQAFSKFGLPDFMAFQNNSSLPDTHTHLRGTNFMRSGPIGSRMPGGNSHFQQMYGMGNPQSFFKRDTGPPSLDSISGDDPPPAYDSQPPPDPFPFANNNSNLDALGRPIKGYFPGQGR